MVSRINRRRRRKYYVVGCADQAAGINGEADFCRFEFPLPTKPGPLSVWATRAQLADNKPATFLSSARKNLERAGMSSSAIDRFLAGDDLTDWKFDSGVSRDVRIELLTAFFEAMRLNAFDPRSLELDTDEVEQADIARKEICLAEVTKKYAKILDRGSSLSVCP